MAGEALPVKYDSTVITEGHPPHFHSYDEQTWFRAYFSRSRKMYIERQVVWNELPRSVTALFMAKGWCRFFNEPFPEVWETEVRQFYATLVRTGNFVAEAFVDQRAIPFSIDILVNKLAQKDVPNPLPCQYPNSSPPLKKEVCIERIAPNHTWDRESFPVGQMSDKARLTFQIVCANILQVSIDSVMRRWQATLVYHLFDTSSVINLARIIYRDIFNAALDNRGRAALPYARLISSILADAGIERSHAFPRLPTAFGQATRRKSAKQMAAIQARQAVISSGESSADSSEESEEEEEEAADVAMGEAADEESADEEDDPDYEWTGGMLTERISALETQFSNFMTEYREDQRAYRRDTSMMVRLQTDLYRRQLGPNEPLPPYFYDPYGPDAPGSSHQPPPF